MKKQYQKSEIIVISGISDIVTSSIPSDENELPIMKFNDTF